jgi:hypothetical protein
MSDDTRLRLVVLVPFVSGVMRDVYEDRDGRQWVVGYDAERVYRAWLPPADDPVIVEAARP